MPGEFKPGDVVRMTRTFRTMMRWSSPPLWRGRRRVYPSRRHIREFGRCVGVVIGLVDYGTQQGPEIDVRWQPSGLRYAYDSNNLELVR